jgi:drug/metabolite transporter (DMT)-like permease
LSTDDAPRADARVWLGLTVALMAASSSAIFIRLADAPPLAVAFWRNAIAVVLLAPFVVARGEGFPRGRALGLGVSAGVFLALHFGLWITSLEHTSVAASVVLVCTQPMFVVILGRLFLKESVGALATIGILVSFAGCVVIAAADSALEGAVLGNVLALLGAVAVAIYVLVGRSARAGGAAFLSYSVLVYAVSAAVLLPACLATEAPLWGYPLETWLWLSAVAVGPNILGHTVFNWALRYLKAAVLSGTILVEPVVATGLAWVILDEVPVAQTLVGGAIVLAGLGLLVKGRD